MSSLNCQPKTTSPSASIVVSESSDNSEPSPPSNPNADSSTRQARLGTWRSRTGFTPAHAAEAKLFMQVQPYVIWEPSEEPKTSEDLKTPTNPEHSEDLKMPANFPVTLETPADPETSGAPEASGDPETSEGPETTIETLGEVWEALGHRMMRLALSDVTEAKLQTMGIVAYPTVTFSIDDILTASFDALTAAEVEPEGIAKLYEDAEDAAQGLLRKYIWLADTVKGENEPRARMFINSAIEAATPLCNGIKFKGGTGKLLMTLEYQTPRVVDTIPATTEDPTSECIGLLGGLTDYTTFFFREWSDTLEHDQEEIQRLIPNIKSMSSDELARLKLISQVQNACVTAYEAKRFEASDNALLRGIPQATAEALVL
ncbi:hypothetical protein FRB90_003863 [Tulasnella sp. 427]|nr:hypothetical protein FRB90_003863 [Tulasnella sp. 427]